MSKKNKMDNKTSIGLKGEYYTLALLSRRGLITSLTVPNTKTVDILVYNDKKNKHYDVQIKTTPRKPSVVLI